MIFPFYTIKRNDYRIHFWDMTKSPAANKKKSSGLSEKSGPF